ncbi:MAG: SBBP repeat-containing protein [Marinisporobacter sp.]|jgi:hypothetical protein|nr:SBBP repeat-containing protein [Marinisporobacter sp.]
MKLKMNNLNNMPISFQVNEGQSESEVKFLAKGDGYNFLFTPKEAVFMLKQPEEIEIDKKADSYEQSISVIRLKLDGADKNPKVIGIEELTGKVNYFKGNNSNHWYKNISTYAKIKYLEVYPGVDLLYYGKNGKLEWDFIVHPGGDPSKIILNFEGSEQVTLDEKGNMILMINNRQILINKPFIYQEIDGIKKEVSGGFIIREEHYISFQLGKYDHSMALIIDPVLSYSTYLGGKSSNSGNGIAVDSKGNVYVVGKTSSTDFPITSNHIQPSYRGGSSDVFVAKINATGTKLLYATYLGGEGEDEGKGIAVDSGGNAYVVGNTKSSNFPTQNPIQLSFGGVRDAFVAKINATGSELIYATYLGGKGEDKGNSIAVDSGGNTYVTGETYSNNFPTQNPIQLSLGGDHDGFVAKINAAGSELVYSTYLGGNGNNTCYSIAVDLNENTYVTGDTNSNNFPTKNPMQVSKAGHYDAFVAKLNADGTDFVYSTYLGGTSLDMGYGITVDSNGNAYVIGYTFSRDFPTKKPIQPSLGGASDAFIVKINPTGTDFVYSTYLGGESNEWGESIAVDSDGNAYVVGETRSNNFPTKTPIQSSKVGSQDIFVTKINADGSALVYSTYLGGTGNTRGSDIAVDANGNAYVTGLTDSSDFPTENPIQDKKAGSMDAFVLKITKDSKSTTTRGLDFSKVYQDLKENKINILKL